MPSKSMPLRCTLVVAVVAVVAAAAACSAPPPPPPPPDPYELVIFDDARITSVGGMPNFQRVRADVDFGAVPIARATLVVDLRSTCYPFESWSMNRPPAGQSWPADCDAFDRNFELTLDEPTAPATAPPALELMRAITPFGGPLHLELDVTDAVNGLPGPHQLTAFIATWSDAAGKVSGSAGGWNVSVRLRMEPGTPPRQVLAVLPLLNDSLGPTARAPIAFEVPPGATAARLELRTTGHGGATDNVGDCIGPAEEFCTRTHHVLVDGAEIAPGLMPWRDDCDTLCTVAHYGSGANGFDYCRENPCGNMRSVRAPRANWCPGSLTPPFVWDDAVAPALLAPGPHELRHTVDGVVDGGSWRTSAALYLYRR
jgi:hypothetical protein